MDYRTYGLELIYNIIRRRLKSINLNLTDRCNSRCRTCYIWKKQPKNDLPVSIIEKLLDDDIVNKKTLFGITGGEPLLHPDCKDILSLFSGYEYLFFSNGILADRLIEAVRKTGIKNLFISADGIDERYKHIRGVDNFENIRRVVRETSDITDITIDFTISPFNTKDDLRGIVDFCESSNVKLIVGAYNEPEFFDTDTKPEGAFEFDDIRGKCFYFSAYANNKFIRLYNKWIRGSLKLPCYSIRSLISILPDGGVSLCQGKNEMLGNLHENSLSEIWNDKNTVGIQRRNKNCNCCFLTCQRPVDIVIGSTPLKWLVK